MDITFIFEWIKREGTVIKAAPTSFCIAVLLGGILLSAGTYWILSQRLADKDERIALCQDQKQALEDKKSEQPKQITPEFLTSENWGKLREAIRLKSGGERNVDIRYVNSCDECSKIGEQLSMMLGSTQGWNSRGAMYDDRAITAGVNILVASNESEALINAAETLAKGFKQVGIEVGIDNNPSPTITSGTIVLTIGKR